MHKKWFHNLTDVNLVDVTFSKLGNIKLKLLEVDGELETLSAGYMLQRYDSGSKPNTTVCFT
tara:strand:+ start:248 stop:433 length:186 start_codon:yes stop_codon:yes gene_type:complete